MSVNIGMIGRLEKACGEATRPRISEPYLLITETVTGRGKSRKVATTAYIRLNCLPRQFSRGTLIPPVDS